MGDNEDWKGEDLIKSSSSNRKREDPKLAMKLYHLRRKQQGLKPPGAKAANQFHRAIFAHTGPKGYIREDFK